jgi:hypothetical protein
MSLDYCAGAFVEVTSIRYPILESRRDRGIFSGQGLDARRSHISGCWQSPAPALEAATRIASVLERTRHHHHHHRHHHYHNHHYEHAPGDRAICALPATGVLVLFDRV